MMADDLSNMETAPDATLVERARAGDRAAFSALVLRHQTVVYRVCYRILGNPDDAADATQEAFLRAYRRLDSFRGQSAFKTWLMRLTVNVSLNERDRRKPTVPLDGASHDEQPDLAIPDPATVLVRAEAARQLHQALQHLPSNHRAAVVLRDLEGFSYAETATALGVPEGTAKGWSHRGRARLKDLLT
jgi:RNA polymerase sigma-70 factor (ECF subfamily)